MKGQVITEIPSELVSVASDGRVASADGIYDYIQQKNLEDLNAEFINNERVIALALVDLDTRKSNKSELYNIENKIKDLDNLFKTVRILEQKIYANEYLTTVALTGGTISFNILKNMGTDMITSISYSTNNGKTWTTTNNVYGKEQHLTISVNVSEGDKVLWKGNAQQLGYWDSDYEDYVGSFFSSNCKFNVQGNVMSMLYGDDFIGEETFEYDAELARLFSNYDGRGCLVVSAEHMVLPATTLEYGCYRSMFQDCYCLVTAPELPATKLAGECYRYMFKGCTSLATAPELPATTLESECYYEMFSGCTSLVTAPKLPATTLANSCYNSMFKGCTILTTAPELPATTLARGCYQNMFYNCRNLTTAPLELPATTLADSCYGSMFEYCTSLVTAPELPATTLANHCYWDMFSGCTNLNSITCLATNISAYYCTDHWVSGVASSGTFKKAASMSSWTTGTSGIPNGWTVQDYSE